MVKKNKEEAVLDQPIDRKSIIRNHLIDILEKKEIKRSFDITEIMESKGRRGLLRKKFPELRHEDRKLFQEILQDLKEEGILFHKSGKFWARLK